VEGVDYEVPDHERYRASRLSKLDERCDEWFGALLREEGGEGGGTTTAMMGALAANARAVLATPVPLRNEAERSAVRGDEWTPYVGTRLPWTPLTPARGLERFGLPAPRRGAEAWRHFDVPGMVGTRYDGALRAAEPAHGGGEGELAGVRSKLRAAGGWLDDGDCAGRLVYVNGRFVGELSKTTSSGGDAALVVSDLDGLGGASDETVGYLSRLTDGFTDELVTGVPVAGSGGDSEERYATSLEGLSGPHQCVGPATEQFAINTQQGTACFAALNTVKTLSVAYVRAPPAREAPPPAEEEDTGDGGGGGEGEVEDVQVDYGKPVLIVNAVTKSGGVSPSEEGEGEKAGVACHPRTLIVAEQHSRLSVIQSTVDLDDDSSAPSRPKLYNGYTQCFLKSGAKVQHSYVEESGGMVVPGVERSTEDGGDERRSQEAARPEQADTHLEAIDVHCAGEGASYKGTVLSLGGSGRVRIALSVTLLRPGSEAIVNGFSLAGGTQRTDMKTNIHHIAQGCRSKQIQKNMIGGRAVGAFRGRIRVEQSAQQTDSQQLSRTVLLSDKARAWAVPSLEIIADDVQCTHGATISDLSEEELFYLRSRGLSQADARNLLMYAFCDDVTSQVDPALLGSVDSDVGLQQRIIRRLENLVPQGERAVKGEFQSI
jgi:hypothetical protein